MLEDDKEAPGLEDAAVGEGRVGGEVLDFEAKKEEVGDPASAARDFDVKKEEVEGLLEASPSTAFLNSSSSCKPSSSPRCFVLVASWLVVVEVEVAAEGALVLEAEVEVCNFLFFDTPDPCLSLSSLGNEQVDACKAISDWKNSFLQMGHSTLALLALSLAMCVRNRMPPDSMRLLSSSVSSPSLSLSLSLSRSCSRSLAASEPTTDRLIFVDSSLSFER